MFSDYLKMQVGVRSDPLLIIIIILLSVLQQFQSLFQGELYTECDVLLPLSISNNFSFP